MGIFKRRKSESPELFFKTLNVLMRHDARFTYYGGFPAVTGVQTPPEQIALTVESDVGERVNLITFYEHDATTDPKKHFRELRDVIDHDGLHKTRAGVIEVTLESKHPAFSDAVRLIGCAAIRKAVSEKAELRASFSIFFKQQADIFPQDKNNWLDAAQRIDASAYIIVAQILSELE